MLKNRCCPWFDKLTMRAKPLKTRDLILSLSKDEAKISCFFKSLLEQPASALTRAALGAQDHNLTRSLKRLAAAPVRRSGAR